jgi:cytochrome c-type biogenesis protein CcmE
MTPRRKRLLAVTAIVAGVAAATTLAMLAFEDNLLYFYNPTQVHDGEEPTDRIFRIGGMVTGSWGESNPHTLVDSYLLRTRDPSSRPISRVTQTDWRDRC